ncbi:TIGR03089 family protein [Actinomadura keratinilytica]
MNAIDRTPADLLRSALAADPARPLVTFYDDATGERVELSVATFANWVAKTANLLQGDLSAEPGDRLALLLPAHWQSAVWLLACHSTGVVAEVGGDPAAADLVVSGPDTLDAARACSGERIALALRPWAGGSRTLPKASPTTPWRYPGRATGSRPSRRWSPTSGPVRGWPRADRRPAGRGGPRGGGPPRPRSGRPGPVRARLGDLGRARGRAVRAPGRSGSVVLCRNAVGCPRRGWPAGSPTSGWT